MYQRRNKMNPLWNNLLVGGFKDGKAFLGSVDYIGTAYEDDFLATGFGSYLAIPILRKKWRPDMEEGEARELMEECLRVLFYRDCRALNKIRIAKATADGTLISKWLDGEKNRKEKKKAKKRICSFIHCAYINTYLIFLSF
jgi:20S proteasome subunit beta 7